MDIHHGCQCHACGRLLKRHRGKRSHCSAACRHQVQVMRKARSESAAASYPLQTLADSYRRSIPNRAT